MKKSKTKKSLGKINEKTRAKEEKKERFWGRKGKKPRKKRQRLLVRPSAFVDIDR